MADNTKGSSAKPSSGEKSPTFTADNTSRAKLLRMGQPIKTGAGGKPSTGA